MSVIKAVLFDLDGTLLPMDNDYFVKTYLKLLAAKMAGHGYDPNELVSGIWKGTGAMIKNDGSVTNETAFWNAFDNLFSRDTRKDEPLFDEFYKNEFQSAKSVCGFEPMAKTVIDEIKNMGYKTALATNPVFPAIATRSRIMWAGLSPEDFEFFTTYENSSFCKPNLQYYLDAAQRLSCEPSQCLMVGNDVDDDMVAENVGMKTFLLTDNLINRKNADISRYERGSFSDLLKYIKSL